MSLDEEDRRPWQIAAKSDPPDRNKDDNDDDKDGDDNPTTPESRFEDRYPQPVRVADLVGKPLILGDNTRIGTIRSVVRTPSGKLALIVPYGGVLGFGARLVAVPIELVGSIGTAIVSLDMGREDYEKAATWQQGQDAILAAETPMRVAITRH